MGQQHLLLVILVTIIVGIATVVAINTFGSAADSANVDAVRNDVAAIASSAQGFYMKPTMLGGGGQSFAPGGTSITFEQMAFAADSLSSNGLSAINANGLYVITNASATDFTVTAHPSSDDAYSAADGFSASADNTLEATVQPDNLTWVDAN